MNRSVRRKWSPAEMPPQTSRNFVVTGANSGVGFETARVLAEAGAHVVLAVRDVARGEAAAARIEGNTSVRHLDLADLGSVHRFADELLGWNDPIDVLINNAGVMAVPEARSADGIELQLATNVVGPFALTNRLLPRIDDRVVTLSSTAHRMGRVRLDDLERRKGGYHPWAVYGQSKLADLLFTTQLQHRLHQARSTVRAVAAHPGLSATNLQGRTGHRVQDALMTWATPRVAMSAWQGALPTLYAATMDVPGDSFVGPDGPLQSWGFPTLVDRSDAARDAETGRKLWTRLEQMSGVTFPF